MSAASAPPGIIVVRLGALATDLGPWRDRVAAEVVQLQRAGHQVVLVHAGGPRVDELLARLDARPAVVEGRSQPDDASFAVIEMAASAVGKDVAAAVQRHGGRALGLTGRDAGMLQARRRAGQGALGDVAEVRVEGLRDLLADGFVVTVAALGTTAEGAGVVLSADGTAAALGAALQADEVLFLGLYDGVMVHGQRVPVLGSHRARLLLGTGEADAVQAPTLGACLQALDGGAKRARIADVRQPGVVAAAGASEPPGTLVVAQGMAEAVRAARS